MSTLHGPRPNEVGTGGRPPDGHTVHVQGLFVKHATTLRGFLCTILPSFDHIDDVMHETFLTVTEKAADFTPETNFVAWVATIARYKALEAARRDRRVPRLLAEDVLDLLCVEPVEDPRDRDRMAALTACLEELGPRARELLDLRYSAALSPAQIARRLDLAAETVYGALSRARAALRACIERRLVAPG